MGPLYKKLLDRYVEELRPATIEVNEWWTRLASETIAKVGTKVAAAAELRRRWPLGPASHPRILAIVRKYYLACDQLNREITRARSSDLQETPTYAPAYPETDADTATSDEEDDLPMNPVILIGESLFTPETQDLANFVGKLTYWPIGIDENGRYL